MSWFDRWETVVWHDGVPSRLRLPREELGTYVSAVSSDGTILGTIRDSIDIPFALIDGTVERLGAHPRFKSGPSARTISADGRICGQAYRKDGFRQVALVWSVDDLAHPSAAYRVPRRYSVTGTHVLDDGGTIVEGNANGLIQAAWWWGPDSQRHRLLARALGDDVRVDAAGPGWAVGTVSDRGQPSRHVRWNLDTGRWRELPPVPQGFQAVDINASGVVAGTTGLGNSSYLVFQHRAVVLPAYGLERETLVATVSDANIAAGTTDGGTDAKAVTWSCRP